MLCDHHQPAPLLGLLIYPTIFLVFLPECHNKLNEEVPAGNVENEGFKHMINVSLDMTYPAECISLRR